MKRYTRERERERESIGRERHCVFVSHKKARTTFKRKSTSWLCQKINEDRIPK